MSKVCNDITEEEMWKVLEESGIKRSMLEKLHPTIETLTHLYSSVKSQKLEASKYKFFNH